LFILIVLILDFQKSILVSETAWCKGPFIYPKDAKRWAKMAVVDITLHYITINVIVLIHAISLLKVVKEN